MACPYNLASNRQTRMLADLSLVGCYNSSLSSIDRDRLMLDSAKRNLKYMPFFMLTEHQKVGLVIASLIFYVASTSIFGDTKILLIYFLFLRVIDPLYIVSIILKGSLWNYSTHVFQNECSNTNVYMNLICHMCAMIFSPALAHSSSSVYLSSNAPRHRLITFYLMALIFKPTKPFFLPSIPFNKENKPKKKYFNILKESALMRKGIK